jgi:hypothetical protein
VYLYLAFAEKKDVLSMRELVELTCEKGRRAELCR